jgi:hypothetical protein
MNSFAQKKRTSVSKRNLSNTQETWNFTYIRKKNITIHLQNIKPVVQPDITSLVCLVNEDIVKEKKNTSDTPSPLSSTLKTMKIYFSSSQQFPKNNHLLEIKDNHHVP